MNPSKRLRQLWPELQAGQPEAVHETRKLSRRAQAALRADGGHHTSRRAWRELRRALAPLRDWDAVGAHLQAGLLALEAGPEVLAHFDAAWTAERAGRQAQLRLPGRPPRFKVPGQHPRRVRRRLERDWSRLVKDAPGQLASPQAADWHQLRKRLKALRYTWELLGEPPQPLLALLDALGRVQDASVALGLLDHPALPPALRPQLAAREQAARLSALTEARGLWPEVAALGVPS